MRIFGDVRQDAVAVGQLHRNMAFGEGSTTVPLDLDGAPSFFGSSSFTSGFAHGKHRAWLLVGTWGAPGPCPQRKGQA